MSGYDRQQLVEAIETGQPVEGEDLRGLDLSGLDLGGANRGALI